MTINPQNPGRYRWSICALLFFATTINYIDRQILSLLKPMLDEKIGWTDMQFGQINSAFQAAYGVSLLIFGWVIDRFGTKVGYALSISAWSIAAIGHALVNTVSGFFGARIALGLGEGGNFPAAIKATAQWFPQKERALATSLFNSGANVGAIVAPAVVPFIAIHYGWHWTFILAGIAGFVWVAVWIPWFDLPEKTKRVSAAEVAYINAGLQPSEGGESVQKVPVAELLGYRKAWSFIIGKFLTDPVWWFFLTWLPDFFKKTRHLDIKNSWYLLVSIYGIITVLSVFGGWVPGYLVSRKGWEPSKARKGAMLFFALLAVPLFYVTKASDWGAVLIIGLAGAGHQAWSANLFTTVSDMFPKRAVATLTGLGSAAGSLGGIGFPLLVGYLLEKFPSTGYGMIFTFCSCAYVLAFVLNHLLAPRFDRVREL